MKLSAAASAHTSKSAGWFLARVRAQTQGDVTLTLRKGTTLQGYRHLCAAAGDSGRFRSGRPAQPLPGQDSPPGPALTDWAHWRRSLAPKLSTADSSSALIGRPLFSSDRRLCGSGEPPGHVLFSASLGGFTQRCFSGTRTMQSRSASTSSKDAGEADNKTKEVIEASHRVYRTSCWVSRFKVLLSRPGLVSGPPCALGVQFAYTTARDVHLRVHVQCINGRSSVIDSDLHSFPWCFLGESRATCLLCLVHTHTHTCSLLWLFVWRRR